MKTNASALVQPVQIAYLDALEPPRDPLLAKMEARAAERRHPISDPEVAAFLAITARAGGAKLVVEVGTNIGYGAIVLARAIGPEGRVVTIERDPELVGVARGFIAEAGLAGRVEVREGSALDELAKIDGPIDLAYVDCVKEEYVAYLDLIVPRLAPRGVVVADNVLWKGLVAQTDLRAVPENERPRTDALRAFNRAIVGHPDLRAMVLPFGDGVAYAVKMR